MNTKSFDFEKSSQSAGWIKELNEEHTPETEEFGISSFVYQKQRPFHPERLKRWLENWPPHIIRAKASSGLLLEMTQQAFCPRQALL